MGVMSSGNAEGLREERRTCTAFSNLSVCPCVCVCVCLFFHLLVVARLVLPVAPCKLASIS